MNLFRRLFWSGLFLAFLSAGLCSAQTVDFTLLYTAPNQQPITFLPDTTIPFSANAPTATITAQYIGNTQATIAVGPAGPPPWLVGSTEFTLAVPMTETFPLTLGPGQSLTFSVTFKPVSSSTAAATITIPYTEPNTAPGATAPISNAIVIPLAGTVPAISFAYAFSNGNAHQIASGGTIPFPPTPLNTPIAATLAVVNTGSGTAELTGVTYPPSTSPFQVSGVPLATPTVPYAIVAGTTTPLEINITYTPTAVENDTGQITFTFQDGTSDTINLSGSGVTSTLSYCTLSGTTCTSLATGGTIDFPPVAVATSGSTQTSSSVIVKVQNTGAATATINSVTTAAPFAVTSTQTFPIPLAQGESTSFTITYTPTQVGSCSPTNPSQCGTLVIGNAVFMLSGTGLGPQLTFSYASAGGTVSIGTSGEVIFPSTQVSQSAKVSFTIANSGTTTATVVLVSASPPFSVPTLAPITLAAGNSTTFPITFTPTTPGSATGTLNVNNLTVGLIGAGTAPPALPSYTITGPSGTAMPATQAPISLTLASSYPVDLEGVLTLTTSGTLPSDQSVQFSTGSTPGNRTVDFVIPAGSTSANFVGQGSQIFVQTGTVAETVTLAPSFMTSGGFDLTPTSPQTLQFTIAPAAPVLDGLQVTNATGTPVSASFQVVLTGYSTTRDLSTVNVTFTPASGFNLTISQQSENISSQSSAWFQSSSSVDSYGGLFQVTIAFNLTGQVPSNQSLLEAISSVAATISNSVGTSSSVQASLQ